jgi:hypothetical protein
MRKAMAALLLAAYCGGSMGGEPPWRPVEGHLMTRWAKDVSPTKALPEYPRPMMVRQQWVSLNGLWQFALRPAGDEQRPGRFDGRVLVPFCVESALSGVKKKVTEEDRIWYRRTFDLPRDWTGQRILLHFGAVDWETTVWVNGREAKHHRGGYDPFSVDITDMLRKTDLQEIVVSVWDPSDKGQQPRGKQVIIPHGFNYTGASGIWQTVWIEPVPKSYIRSVYTVVDIDGNCAWVTVDTAGTHDGYTLEARALLPEAGRKKGTIPVVAEGRAGQRLRIRLREHPETRLWSPDSPYLYDLQVTLKDREGRTIDRVDSYFGMRKIAVQKDEDGINRLFLNNKPLFHYGFLDQGWWPDGLYTAPTDEALRYDIETAKRLGANMVRKHVKFEPQRFYYHCDRLGVLVWQDMPSGTNGDRMKPQFRRELKGMIDAARAHPSIVMWVLFNEGWGQHDAPRLAKWVKQLDPTRLVDHASGWADRGDFGDVRDIHLYPEPGVSPVQANRAIVLGEFGGIGWNVKGHMWIEGKGHGHSGIGHDPGLTKAYLQRIRALRPMIGAGLSAACYTQISDIEAECNGVMTYDREMLKLDAKLAAAETRKLYGPPPVIKTVLATSQRAGQTWRYTTADPGGDWFHTSFDDSKWKTGRAGFGHYNTPTYPLRIVDPATEWTSSDIWIRRTFDLDDTELVAPHFLIFHDDSADVFINGKQVLNLPHSAQFYRWIRMEGATVKLLKKKGNVIAVHASNKHHPQYIDVGIVDVLPATRAATPEAGVPGRTAAPWRSW